MIDDEKWSKIAESSSVFDRVKYLFGGTKSIALFISLVAVVSSFGTSISFLISSPPQVGVIPASGTVDRIVPILLLSSIQETQIDNLEKDIQALSLVVSQTNSSSEEAVKSLKVIVGKVESDLKDVRLSANEIGDRLRSLLKERGQKSGSNWGIIGSAFADTPAVAPTSPRASGGFLTIDSMRPFVMLFIIAIITFFFGVCIWLFCVTTDVERLKFADNMIRTIIGFYIGIVTGLLGLPTTSS